MFTVNYDGMFEEQRPFGLLAASSSLRPLLLQEGKTQGPPASLQSAVEVSLRLWGLASLLQTSTPSLEPEEESSASSLTGPSTTPDEESIASRIREALAKESLECVLLDRESGKMETYRTLSLAELQPLIPSIFQPVT